ncbi:LysR family transcriptional regulator [Cupriavidus gilardii CR3]|nr:LysR family transcriptional regulator [Cupriavidus gilardii CR3]
MQIDPNGMDRFDALQLFTRIVELGTFSGAANALNIPRATATHAIKELEARLGVRLLERTTRQVRPRSTARRSTRAASACWQSSKMRRLR